MKKEKLDYLTVKLEKGIKEVFDSEKYKKYLSTMSKFHTYSYRNSLLIMLQKPDATYVAGFNAWNKNFKRYVNKGEKGIQILAPAPYKTTIDKEKIDYLNQKPVLDKKGQKIIEKVEVTKVYFKPVYVFDVSQTKGEPLPELITELSGNYKNYKELFESIKSISPFKIQFEDIKSGAKGYCQPSKQKIAIKKGMSDMQNIKTAIHEITHADLHADNNLSIHDKKDSHTKEIEAESTAFIVCDYFGIDTSDYSFGYIASWSKEKELNELKQSLDTIQKQSLDLINKIDTRFQELLKNPDITRQENRLQQEMLDTVKFDNDIDLDKVKNREQLGFKSKSLSERMKEAKDLSKLSKPKQSKKIEREER